MYCTASLLESVCLVTYRMILLYVLLWYPGMLWYLLFILPIQRNQAHFAENSEISNIKISKFQLVLRPTEYVKVRVTAAVSCCCRQDLSVCCVVWLDLRGLCISRYLLAAVDIDIAG